MISPIERFALPDEAMLLAHAQSLAEAGDFPAAETAFARAIAFYRLNLHAYLGAAEAASHDGNAALSGAYLRLAAEALPDNQWPVLRMADQCLARGEVEAAEQFYRAAIEREPDSAFGHLGLGKCARARGTRREALAHFEAACARDPGNAWSQLESAAEHRAFGNLDAAEAGYRSFMEILPDNIYGPLGLAQCARMRGDGETAIAMFERARSLEPGNAAILIDVAKELRDRLRLAESAAALEQAVALAPHSCEVILFRGERALSLFQVDEALRIYQDGVAHHPDNVWMKLGLVDALWALGQVDAALAAISPLSDGAELDERIALKTLTLLRHLGDLREAVRLGREFTQRMPNAFWLAVELFECEKLVSSEEAMQAALARIPAETVEEQAVKARMRGGFAEIWWRPEEALSHYEAGIALDPQDAWNHYDAARIKILLLDLAGARAHMLRFQEITGHVTRMRGRSLNISQTHYGELINDYGTDTVLLEQVQAISRLPAASQIDAFRALMVQNPGSTAVSVGLMLALRRSGVFSRPAPQMAAAGAAAKIPRAIIQFWDAPTPPDDVARLMASWSTLNPQHAYRRFNLEDAAEFLAARWPEPVSMAFARAREPAQKADIFRLAWLALEGGIYADADDRCTAPIETLLPPTAELMLYQEDHGTICNNVIAARPQHPVILRALQMAVNDTNAGSSETVWFVSGPGLLTRAFAQYLAETGLVDGALPQGIIVHDRREMFAAVSMNCSPGYKRSGGHWSAPATPPARAERAEETAA